ncbi:MAG: hypothetical protein GY711_18130 [bacterium]|nr:hypothetical protein [bacterium]
MGQPSEFFGSSFALDGAVMIVGAPNERVNNQLDAGAVHAFERVGGSWQYRQRLLPSSSFASQVFGLDVAIDGDRALLSASRGAPSATADGEIFEFQQQSGVWQQTQILAQGTSDSNFGIDIAASAGRLAAAAPGARSVFMSELSGGAWVQTQVIDESSIAPLPFPSQTTAFGRWVAMRGSTLVVGHSGPAAVHVFEYDGTSWQFVSELRPGGADFPGTTQSAIALTEDLIAVGSEFANSGRGEVWIYEKLQGSWQSTQVLLPADVLAIQDRFGAGVSLSGELLAVGRSGDDSSAIQAGAVHLFGRESGSWTEVVKVEGETPSDHRSLGSVVRLQGHDLYASADFGSAPWISQGAVYEYLLTKALGTAYCISTPNSTGGSALLTCIGRPDVETNCIELRATAVPAGQFGYFLMSGLQGFVPSFGASQGNLCLALPIVRFSSHILVASSTNEVGFAPDLTRLPQGTVFQPGETWNFQLWFRDVNPGQTSNTTDGLAITFETGGAPTVQFPATLTELEEQATTFEVEITLSQPTETDVSVPYTVGGTATADVDWRVEEPNPLSIPAGTMSVGMTIVVVEDSEQEGDENAVVLLQAPTGAVLGTAPQFTLTIVDDD